MLSCQPARKSTLESKSLESRTSLPSSISRRPAVLIYWRRYWLSGHTQHTQTHTYTHTHAHLSGSMPWKDVLIGAASLSACLSCRSNEVTHCSHCPRLARAVQQGHGQSAGVADSGPEITPRYRGRPSETGEAAPSLLRARSTTGLSSSFHPEADDKHLVHSKQVCAPAPGVIYSTINLHSAQWWRITFGSPTHSSTNFIKIWLMCSFL